MIETQDLSKQFDGFWAVDGVTLKVAAGQVLVLLGPNGAGKTTSVRMMTTILRPTRGTARVAGYDVLTHPELVRALVGVLTEQHGLYPRMTGQEYLEFFGRAYKLDGERLRARIADLLEFFGLEPNRHKRIGQYSKGMRQKLALARALLHDPPVLLLDEPTSAMDPASARLVRNAIHDLRSEKRAIILCTHNLSEAEELADQIAIIHRGKILVRGTAQELKQALSRKSRYHVHFAAPLPQPLSLSFPNVSLLETQKDGFIYETPSPQATNPALLTHLLAMGLNVYRLEEQEVSLEEVYLHIVQTQEEKTLAP